MLLEGCHLNGQTVGRSGSSLHTEHSVHDSSLCCSPGSRRFGGWSIRCLQDWAWEQCPAVARSWYTFTALDLSSPVTGGGM